MTFEQVVADWCDHHRGYVEPGTTRPFTTERGPHGARACGPCIEQMKAAVAAREGYCPECRYLLSFHIDGRCPQELGPRGARAMAGNR